MIDALVGSIAITTAIIAATMAWLISSVRDGWHRAALITLLTASCVQSILTVPIALVYRNDLQRVLTLVYAAIIVRAIGIGALAMCVFTGASVIAKRDGER